MFVNIFRECLTTYLLIAIFLNVSRFIFFSFIKKNCQIVKFLSQHCWCSVNQIWVRLASLESDELLPYTKGCPNRWSRHDPSKLKSESNKDGSNYFEWLCIRVLFSCFLRDFYRADDTIVIALMVHSCIFWDDDCHQDGNQALAR